MSEMQDNPELAEIFRAEMSEMLDTFAGLLEHLHSMDSDVRARGIQAAFRVMHTMKGAASVFGALSIATLAHAVEDALGRFRNLPTGPSNEDIALIAETIPILEGLALGTLNDDAIKPYIARIQAACDHAPDMVVIDPPTPSLRFHAATSNSRSEPEPPAPDLHGTESFVRVDVQRLDRLLARVGELLPLQSHLLGYAEDLESILQSLTASDVDIAEIHRRLGALLRNFTADARKLLHTVDDVVDTTKRVRMLPLAAQSSHWNRLVHEAARTLGKHADVETDVGNIELDKRIFDALRDPLFHILRNAIDHGIEPPMFRQRAGKSEIGRILISARMSGTMVDIDISDDGAGIDTEAVREKAIANGLVPAEQAADLSAEDVTTLVFLPGLSTARSVSTLSGRGVGLDAVRQVVRSLGGSVNIVPPTLGGTTIRLRVPVTIALLRGLLVRADNHFIVFPIEHVVHVRRVKRNEVRRVGGLSILDLPEGPLRLKGSEIPNRQGSVERTDTLTVVVLTHGKDRIGFVVESVVGEQQFIMRSLPWNLQSVPGVGGVVFLPDRTVAMVVDVAHVFERGDITSPKESPAKAGGPSRILVVDDSMAIRTMMRHALEGAGYQVFVNADGYEAWETLHSREIDLLVSDVRMPRIDGLELTKRVRADSRLAHLPIVLVTSLDRSEDLVAGANAGANEYIVKAQLNQSNLLDAVARLV